MSLWLRGEFIPGLIVDRIRDRRFAVVATSLSVGLAVNASRPHADD
jgi:hypothetical protein